MSITNLFNDKTLNIVIWVLTTAIPLTGVFFRMENKVYNLSEKVKTQEQKLAQYELDRQMLLQLNNNFATFTKTTTTDIQSIKDNTTLLVLINAKEILKYQNKNIN